MRWTILVLTAIAFAGCSGSEQESSPGMGGRLFSDFRWDGGASDAQECPLYDCLKAVVATCPLPVTAKCTRNLSAQEDITCFENGMKIVLTPIQNGVLVAVTNADGSTCLRVESTSTPDGVLAYYEDGDGRVMAEFALPTNGSYSLACGGQMATGPYAGTPCQSAPGVPASSNCDGADAGTCTR
jgi:hypothetical protein